MRRNRAGFALVAVVPILLLIVAAVTVYWFISRGIVRNPLAPKQEATVTLQTQYSNPFDKNTQYANPFSQYKNPFDIAE